MAGTTSTTVQQLYADIVADLQPYFDDAVLLPNEQFILNSFSIEGTSGSTVRIPITNSYTDGATVAEGTSIAAAAQSNFSPTAANISMTKRGVATDVSEEALEDGGMEVVRNAVLTRLSRGLAQATDVAGFTTANAAYTHQGGNASLTGSGNVVNFIISPLALGYAVKRSPETRAWYNPDTDVHEMRASIRNGFVSVYDNFGSRLNDSNTIGSGTLTLDGCAKSVAYLRSQNAPTASDGLYIGFVAPSSELSIASQLNSVSQSSIGSLSDVGNRALLSGLIGQAAGVTFFRSNNLPQG